MISPGIFVMFYKGQKNGPKWRKICLSPYFRNCTSYDCGFWYTCVKWWYLQQHFFSFFQNSDFSGFSKFINKCEKEILRCVPPSLHVCDFFFCIFTEPFQKFYMQCHVACWLARLLHSHIPNSIPNVSFFYS